MQIPDWAIVMGAVVAATPFGWLIGVAVGELIVGRDFGVFPVLIMPLGWIAGVSFALTSRIRPVVRLAALAAGTGVLLLVV